MTNCSVEWMAAWKAAPQNVHVQGAEVKDAIQSHEHFQGATEEM